MIVCGTYSAGSTTTVPAISGWEPQKYGTVPAMSKMTVALSSGKNSPVSKLSSIAVAVWPTGSSFVHLIESPRLIVIGSGAYLEVLIVTPAVTGSSGEQAGNVKRTVASTGRAPQGGGVSGPSGSAKQ